MITTPRWRNRGGTIVVMWLVLSACVLGSEPRKPTIFLEAESFADRGGWVIDTQSMDQMGSPYLLAHGLGVPVPDAVTTIDAPVAGSYRVWVRTRDWVAPWGASDAPGRFGVLVNGKSLEVTFGIEGAPWHWQDGGTVHLPEGTVSVALRDLSGFDGRCDAILLTTDSNFRPTNEDAALADLRRQLLSLPVEPEDGGMFDLVVVGGGMAGCCACSTRRHPAGSTNTTWMISRR